MIIISNFMIAIAQVLNVILGLIQILLILAAIFSWFPSLRYNQAVMAINSVVDKILKPIRKFVPTFSGIDLSFIVAFIIVIFVQSFVVASLLEYAVKIKGI